MKLLPVPVSRLLGLLVIFQGAVLVFFWKVLDFALATGMERYASNTGRLARMFFSDDRHLVELLQFGQDWVPCLLYLGLAVMVPGILAIAFPLQTAQLLKAIRILRTADE